MSKTKGKYFVLGLRRRAHREYRPHKLRPETLFADIQQMWGEASIEIIRPIQLCMSIQRVHALLVRDSPKAIDRHNKNRAFELVGPVTQ